MSKSDIRFGLILIGILMFSLWVSEVPLPFWGKLVMFVVMGFIIGYLATNYKNTKGK